MKNQLKQIFRSSKFVTGFVIFMAILLTVIIYPLFVTADPLHMVGGLFYKPGTYISVSEAIGANTYTLDIETSGMGRVESQVDEEEFESMIDWLTTYGGVEESLSVDDLEGLVESWIDNYDSTVDQTGLLSAEKKAFARLDKKIREALKESDILIATKDEDGELNVDGTVTSDTYINVKDITSKRTLVLGADNFGKDVLTQLVAATKTSLKIGLIAGSVATLIGLTFGLLAGYVGGVVDDIIVFITNMFTVIPSFVLLILISYSIGKGSRGAMVVAVVIGLTSWTWTARSVRSQVISLRNRDHVNLSKLSGHSLFRIVVTDILPYVASYVVMAFILQISSAILAEAQLSMLGLGPSTSTVATLGLMMNWALSFKAPMSGAWWAFMPVILVIALVSFSLNLMNTGLDQVFNPTLRD